MSRGQAVWFKESGLDEIAITCAGDLFDNGAEHKRIAVGIFKGGPSLKVQREWRERIDYGRRCRAHKPTRSLRQSKALLSVIMIVGSEAGLQGLIEVRGRLAKYASVGVIVRSGPPRS